MAAAAAVAVVSFRNMTGVQQHNFIQTFMASPPNVPNSNGQYVGGRLLGAGSDGPAGLWLQLDANLRIINRIVIKAVQFDAFEFPLHGWYYRIGNEAPPFPPYTPQEAYCQTISNSPLLVMPPPRDNVLRSFNWVKRAAPHFDWRLYMEYAPFGSINDFILLHQSNRMVNRAGRRRLERGKPIPEAFIWCVFEGLVRAAISMHNPPNLPFIGTPMHHPTALWGRQGGRNGSEVVHQDLKPSNVFLGERDPNRFAPYPQVKIADFGRARLTRPLEPIGINPAFYLTDGHTPNFIPPEINDPPVLLPPGAPANLVPPGTRALHYTNIWQMGMIMRCLMRLETEQEVVFDQWNIQRFTGAGPGPHVDNWVPPMTGLRDNYSVDLITLVQRCLQHDPAHRPTPQALLASIHQAWAAAPPAAPLHANMDIHPPQLHWNNRHNIGRRDPSLTDTYVIGFSARNFP